MSLPEILILVTGAVGVFGWFFAWRARGEVGDVRKELAIAVADATNAKDSALQSGARAVTAEGLVVNYRAQYVAVTAQLDAERRSRQSLVDALAKAGVPVGGVVVDTVMDGLYQDGGGQGPDAGTGGGQAGLSGQPAPAPLTPTKG
jgi:hypothetical protein